MVVVRRVVCSLVCALLLVAGWTAVAQADSSSPTVSGPVTGGNGVPIVFAHTTFPLASVGYTQQEFFVGGTATAYTPTAPLTGDGKWSVAPSSHATYKTRIVVDRPIRRRDFNGTVVVEWLNVTGGVDASPDWIHMHDELVRAGYAWVGVSAQAVGLNALKNPANASPAFGDPVRYASLTHPGDSYSYDMFSQAGEAIRDHTAKILGGSHLERLIGVGESQSAGRLVTYIDAVHPRAHVYDGFLVHSRGASGSPLSQAPLPTVTTPSPTFIRTDLHVPVLQFETETDLIQLGFLAARQPDTRRIATWEVTGTAHFDLYGLQTGATDTGNRQSVAAWFASMQHPTNQPTTGFTCGLPINSGPQTFVLRAAIAAENRWIARGVHPPTSPRMQTLATTPPQLAVGADGIVLGGIRTPAVDAPVAKLSGLGQTGGTQFCNIFGTTVPFTNQQLSARYHSHGGFTVAWILATIESARAGFLRPVDAFNLAVVGARSDVLR
jgi:alpha/beta hydrolase family protein